MNCMLVIASGVAKEEDGVGGGERNAGTKRMATNYIGTLSHEDWLNEVKLWK